MSRDDGLIPSTGAPSVALPGLLGAAVKVKLPCGCSRQTDPETGDTFTFHVTHCSSTAVLKIDRAGVLAARARMAAQ